MNQALRRIDAYQLSPEALRERIFETYEMQRPYQWAIEATRNVIEAVRRKKSNGWEPDHPLFVDFTFAMLHNGAKKGVIANTGPFMERSELEGYIAQIGEGSGARRTGDNPKGNRHSGGRESIVPWNRAGVVYGSYHPEHLPEGAMVWIADLDPEIGPMLVRPESEFPHVMEFGKDHFGFDWKEAFFAQPAFRHMREHGGVFIAYLGEKIDQPTDQGVDISDLARKLNRPSEDRRGLWVTMRDAFTDTCGVQIRVDGINERSYLRAPMTLDDWVTRPGSSPVSLDGHQKAVVPISARNIPFGIVEFTLLDEERAGRKGGFRGAYRNHSACGMGHSRVAYRYDLLPVGSKSHQAVARSCGITSAAVQRRVRLIFRLNSEPNDQAYVIQDPSRSYVKMSDGRDVPWQAIFDSVRQSLPKFIEDACREESGEESGVSAKDYEHYQNFYRTSASRRSANGPRLLRRSSQCEDDKSMMSATQGRLRLVIPESATATTTTTTTTERSSIRADCSPQDARNRSSPVCADTKNGKKRPTKKRRSKSKGDAPFRVRFGDQEEFEDKRIDGRDTFAVAYVSEGRLVILCNEESADWRRCCRFHESNCGMINPSETEKRRMGEELKNETRLALLGFFSRSQMAEKNTSLEVIARRMNREDDRESIEPFEYPFVAVLNQALANPRFVNETRKKLGRKRNR